MYQQVNLLLQKDIYPSHMKSWMIRKFQWNIIVRERKFLHHLNIENVTDADYMHAKKKLLKILK